MRTAFYDFVMTNSVRNGQFIFSGLFYRFGAFTVMAPLKRERSEGRKKTGLRSKQSLLSRGETELRKLLEIFRKHVKLNLVR